MTGHSHMIEHGHIVWLQKVTYSPMVLKWLSGMIQSYADICYQYFSYLRLKWHPNGNRKNPRTVLICYCLYKYGVDEPIKFGVTNAWPASLVRYIKQYSMSDCLRANARNDPQILRRKSLSGFSTSQGGKSRLHCHAHPHKVPRYMTALCDNSFTTWSHNVSMC
jgi:hypothetical protein